MANRPNLAPVQIALQIAEKLREIATRQGTVPFWRGDLRKSHITEPRGSTGAILSANTPYARAVHDGRRAVTITPKRKKALFWPGARHPVRSVRQPARPGNPWLARSVKTLQAEGLGWLAPRLGPEVVAELEKGLRGSRGLRVRS